MQPPVRRTRRIVRDLRTTAPLVYERLSDPILVRRAKDGDKLALEALCARHSERVHRIALHVLRDPEDARDAAQDSLVKLVQRVGQFRGSRSSRPGCTASSSTRARTSRRRAGQRAHASRCSRTGASPPTATRRARSRASETRRELGRCLAELPAAQAQVVALKDAFDVPFEEISAATGLPVGTAKCYAHRGRDGMRERLSAHERGSARPGRDRGDPPAPRADAPDRRGAPSSSRASASSRARPSPKRTAPATSPATRSCPA